VSWIELDVEALAAKLEQAFVTNVPITPLSEAVGLSDVADAYRIQSAWSELRVRNGDRVVGRKIGLTSRAMREAAGINEPDFGQMWASRHLPIEDGRAELPATTFIQPRIEGEIAFLMGRELAGPGVTVADVLAATEALAPSFEVVDSRIIRRKFSLVDTISDNASYGAFCVGPWDARLRDVNLRTLGMLVTRGEEAVVEGIGAASLGHPAAAVAWLANTLAAFSVTLAVGDIVLSGSLGAAIPVRAGDVFVMELHGTTPLTLAIT
jgi:2-keto-4-pentenoate hydratase